MRFRALCSARRHTRARIAVLGRPCGQRPFHDCDRTFLYVDFVFVSDVTAAVCAEEGMAADAQSRRQIRPGGQQRLLRRGERGLEEDPQGARILPRLAVSSSLEDDC
jgi:hypothetical protein